MKYLTESVGTLGFIAPEVDEVRELIRQDGYGPECDVWSIESLLTRCCQKNAT